MPYAISCPSCNAHGAPGSHWCNSCRVHLSDPALGRLSTPGKRLGAYLLDVVIPTIGAVVGLAVGGMMGGLLGLGGASTGTGRSIGIVIGIGMVAAYCAVALVLFCRGTTPGKYLLRMRVIKQDGSSAGFLTMLGREWIGKPISGLIFSLGYIWILIDRDNQGWHDKLLGTHVVEV